MSDEPSNDRFRLFLSHECIAAFRILEDNSRRVLDCILDIHLDEAAGEISDFASTVCNLFCELGENKTD